MFIFAHEEINLLEAAQDGKLEFIKTQLAPLTSKHLQDVCKKIDYYGRNALHYAAYRGHYEVVEYFLDLQVIDINTPDNQGMLLFDLEGNTALLLACVRCYNSDVETLQDGRKYLIVKLLLNRGASLTQYARNGINNPLHWSCFFSDLKTTWILLQNNPTLMLFINDKQMFSVDLTLMSRKAFHNRKQNEQVVEYLIIKFLVEFLGSEEHRRHLYTLDMQSERSFEVTPVPRKSGKKDSKSYETVGLRYLFWASILGREDLATALLKFSFSPFLPSYRGRNAVHAAAYHGHLHLLKLYLEGDFVDKKVSTKKLVNLQTLEKPQTALHIAVERGYENVVAYLIEMGADHSFYNFRNHRAFDSSRLPNIKKLRQNLIKDSEKNMIRAGYKYVLLGYLNAGSRGNLVEQQLKNIQDKNSHKGKVKVMPIPSYDERHIHYVIKVEDSLKVQIAEDEQMMIYNQRDGFMCQFQIKNQEVFENFHPMHDQQILLRLLYDEFDLDQFINDGLLREHYPLHDEDEKAQIYQFWRKEKWRILWEPFSLRDCDTRTASAIQSYFGAEVGFFFVFITFFNTWLILPALPGIIVGVYSYVTGDKSSSYVPIYIIFLAVWATIFFEFWKRK